MLHQKLTDSVLLSHNRQIESSEPFLQFGDAGGLLGGDDNGATTGVYDQSDYAAFDGDGAGFAFAGPDIEAFGGRNRCLVGFAACHRQNAELAEGDGLGFAGLESDGEARLAVFCRADGGDGITKLDEAVALEDLGGGFGQDGGENAKLGHHKNGVHGQHGHAFREVGVEHHQGRLGAVGGVREDAAAADNHVELEHLDERFARGFVKLHAGLGVAAFQPPCQRLVMVERQAQGFAGDGLFNLKVFERLRDCRRADHFVAELVAKIRVICLKRNPSGDLGQAGFGQDVADGVRHAEICGDGADKVVVED